MSREKTLFKNTIIITIGKVCTQLITFFLLPLYTAILTTEEFGIVDLLNTLVLLLLPIITFQIEQAVFRNLIDVRENISKKKEIVSTGFFSVTIQCIIYLIMFLIISPYINNNYKYFLATNVIAYTYSSLMLQIARGLGENQHYAIGSFVSAFFTIVFNILFLVVFKFGANGMLVSNMLGQLICAMYCVMALKIYKYIDYKAFNKVVLTTLRKYSIPLVPNAISWWIFNASDRVIVSAILGVSQNGILAAAHKFSAVYITIYNIFNLSWTEMVSMHIDDSDAEEFFSNIINTMLRFFTGLGIGIIAFVPFVYPIMINSKFSDGYNQVPILLIGSIFNIVIGLISAIYIAKKNTKIVASTSAISAMINIVVHLVLIKFIGLYAASVSTLVAYLVMAIYRLKDLRKRYFEISIDRKFVFITSIVVVPILIAYYSNNINLYIAGAILSILYAYKINKNDLNKILRFILKRK